ncbi:MAG: alkaline phosphatase family protein [Candidatus Binatia bacterium]
MAGAGAPLLVIGLDGATLDLVGPWAAAGRLPHLARLLGAGAWARLASTVPPATFPAWTSLFTGVNPGRHGVLDFTERVPGTWRMRLVTGRHRRVPALWNRMAAAGRRVAVLTVPATYPPEPVPGIMVSGWDSPLTTAIDGSFVHPRAFFADIRARIGRLPFADFQEIATGPGWHARALASLLDGIERRTCLAETVLARERWDACVVVFGESDTVAHHFWRYHDAGSPRYEVSPFAGAIARVYEALDAAVGRLVAAAPPDVAIAVVSDHGSGGAGDRVVHLNRRLAECDLLGFGAAGGMRVAGLARAAALRGVPHRLQAGLLRRAQGLAGRLEGMHRFGGIDWPRTLAYSEELDYHPSVWVNLCGREPAGVVEPADYERVRERVIAALREWVDDAGRPVVARVHRREALYRGPASSRAPDLVVELASVAGYSPSCLRSAGPGPAVRQLTRAEHGAGKGAGMNGAHRPDGLLVLCGRGVAGVGDLGPVSIVDVLPTLLALAGLSVPDGLDGHPVLRALREAPRFAADPVPVAVPLPFELPAEAAQEVSARLAALGYLEPGG